MADRGPWTGHLTALERVCFCVNGWVCEAHPECGWPHDQCAGAGVPCPRCHPAGAPPPMPAGWRSHAAPDAALYFVYGRNARGSYFLGNTTSIQEGVRRGRAFLDRYPRVTVESVRENLIVWDSNDLHTGRLV